MDFIGHFITKTLIFLKKNKELLGKICYNKKQAEVVERQTRMLQAHVPVRV